MTLIAKEREIEARAIAYVTEHRRMLARAIVDPVRYPPEENPVSVFMAGSPGAGKTEASRALVDQLGGAGLRIDLDDYRELLPGYDCKNSRLFQRAIVRLVDKVLDEAFKRGQSFILDSTLSNYDVASRNIRRALAKGRAIQILYVYQDACQAWHFVKEREAFDGRSIPFETFIEQYFSARDVVNKLKRELGGKVVVDLLIKNLDGGNRVYQSNILSIDGHVKEKYNAQSLGDALGPKGGG